MGRKADVNDWQKGVIAFGRAKGHSVKEVAEFAGVSKRTVIRVYQQWQQSQSTGNSRQNCGRKAKLTDRDRLRVSQLVTQNRFASRQELLVEVNAGPSAPISERTLRRELHTMNIWSREARKRPSASDVKTDVKRPNRKDGRSDCSSVDEPLENFFLWCEEVNLKLSSKVYVTKEGTVSDYGMLALEDIEGGHVLFSIPRHALLHPGTSKTKKVLEEGSSCLESLSGWVPLLLALMYEYTSDESYWKPYLSLWPDFRKLDHPMFWSKEEREKLLKGTGIPEAVNKDLSNIQEEYNDTVLPFMRSNPELWDPSRHTLELYQSLVAFVMAYSFQEPNEDEEEDPNPPMMVPMADMLNHVSHHNANLEYTPECLNMVAVRSIRKGEEIFNTYGQMANWQLLHMYGFTEPFPTNANDTADIHMTAVYKAAQQGTGSKAQQRLLVDKWKTLHDMDVVREKDAFVFGKSGSLTDMELYTTLKVLCMSKEKFQEFQKNEAQDVDEDEDEDGERSKAAQALSFEGMSALAPTWKRLLHTAAGFTLNLYAEDVESDLRLMEEPKALAQLSHRERRALDVRVSQKSILGKLQQLTQTGPAQ